MQWGKKWPVPMNLSFFAVEAYVPGGVQNQAEKNSKDAFRLVPVPKSTFSVLLLWQKHDSTSAILRMWEAGVYRLGGRGVAFHGFGGF